MTVLCFSLYALEAQIHRFLILIIIMQMVGPLLWVQQYTFTKLIGLTENMIIRPWFEPSHPSPSPEPEDRITINWAVLRYSHSPVLDIQGHGSFKRRMERGNHRDKMSFSGFINCCKSSVNLYFFKGW